MLDKILKLPSPFGLTILHPFLFYKQMITDSQKFINQMALLISYQPEKLLVRFKEGDDGTRLLLASLISHVSLAKAHLIFQS